MQEVLHILLIKDRKKKGVVIDVCKYERKESRLKEVMPNVHNSF